MSARKSLRNATVHGIKPHAFIKARLSKEGPGGYVTITIEGHDMKEPSVAGIGIKAQELDKLILRLNRLRLKFS